MPDLLTHVLIAYSVCLVLVHVCDWIRAPYITVAMAGALVPDLAKGNLILSRQLIHHWTGVPFSWSALHTTGGVVLSILVIVVLIEPPYRTRVGTLLALGAGSHLVLDVMLRSVTGQAFPIFWPLTGYEPPTPGLYLSTDPWPTAIALMIAGFLTAIHWIQTS
ncbi:metal-dependent hydrolase [Halosimplex halobium]|uniref:metal-dependent hydrolase n=1 Tax=Halosimplex halobium TaxID=3396618 RepID=UPI003F559910